MNKKQKEKFNQLLIEAGLKSATSTKILHILDQALIPEPKKPRVPKVSNAVTLQQWETAQGKRLDIRMMIDWLDRHNYAIDTMAMLVEEFRTDMISKDKPYADFRAAFQNYFNKGYLSIKPDSPRVKRASVTTLDRRGFSL